MRIEENFSLKNHNTFGIDAKAKHFVEVNSQQELVDFLLNSPFNKGLKLLLGGGSNMLLTQNIDGTVLHLNLLGKSIVEEDEKSIVVESAAGENWHEFVLWTIENNWGGIENMSLIPGNIGTAPIQNIGAYGVELKDTFHCLKAVEISTGKARTFSKEDCQFGYRNSVFKNELKGKFIITHVQLQLHKKPHTLRTTYGAIQSELEKNNITHPTIKDVSNAVISIRQSKLPDPKKLGNSGSFFKNPVVKNAVAEKLKSQFENMPQYPVGKFYTKLAAGWLIEQAGLKGHRHGDAGVHKKQALVLVNYGNATGTDILKMAEKVIETVQQKFGISLQPEVNII